MTKEEILSSLISDIGYNYENIKVTEGFANDLITIAEKAMSEFADQEKKKEAIEFAEWIIDRDNWSKMQGNFEWTKTTEQEYLDFKNKP
jgi:hypothetical protein